MNYVRDRKVDRVMEILNKRNKRILPTVWLHNPELVYHELLLDSTLFFCSLISKIEAETPLPNRVREILDCLGLCWWLCQSRIAMWPHIEVVLYLQTIMEKSTLE